jgi:tRNA A-37 threonylcarbamoyl transferase component Bud32
MSIAVIVSGEYREFDLAHDSWPFIKWPTVDFYFSTWNTTTEVNDRLGIHIKEEVTINRIANHGLNIIAYAIDNLDENLTNQQKMIERWHKGVELLSSSNLTYDSVILIRPDLFLDFDEDLFYKFVTNIEEDCIYALGESTNSVQDQLIIGTPKSVSKLSEMYYSKDLSHNTNIHWYLATHFSKMYTEVKDIPFRNYCLLRSNSRQLDNKTLQEVKKDAAVWYSNKYYSETVLHCFTGFSGSEVALYQTSFGKLVRKTKFIERNYEKLVELASKGYSVPKILSKQDDVLEMEYVEGVDMKTFLLYNEITLLTSYLSELIDKFKIDSLDNDYSDVYARNLMFVDDDNQLPFNSYELFDRLPKLLPSSTCHGDLTLENLIYSTDNRFVLIDVSSGDYDSWVFDIAKLRQDLDAKWFLRNTDVDLSAHLAVIKSILYEKFPLAFDDNLYILMLLRVYRHCTPQTPEHNLILSEIKRLWK